MSARKPVRWTIPDVKKAPLRALSPDAEQAAPRYPSAAEIVGSPEWRAWLDAALVQILRPAAFAGAVALAASGCGTSASADDLLGGDPSTGAPVFAPAPEGAPGYSTPATLVATGDPYGGKPEYGGGVIGGSLPEILPPCPLPPPPGTTPVGTPPIPVPHPPAIPGGLRPALPPSAPPATRGGPAMVHVPPPATTPPRLAGRVAPTRPILPHPDPPDIEGDIAIVHPE